MDSIVSVLSILHFTMYVQLSTATILFMKLLSMTRWGLGHQKSPKRKPALLTPTSRLKQNIANAAPDHFFTRHDYSMLKYRSHLIHSLSQLRSQNKIYKKISNHTESILSPKLYYLSRRILEVLASPTQMYFSHLQLSMNPIVLQNQQLEIRHSRHNLEDAGLTTSKHWSDHVE